MTAYLSKLRRELKKYVTIHKHGKMIEIFTIWRISLVSCRQTMIQVIFLYDILTFYLPDPYVVLGSAGVRRRFELAVIAVRI